MNINFKKLHADAYIPTRGTAEAAGLDLYALEDCEIKPCVVTEHRFAERVHVGQLAVRTGLMCEIPKGYFGKVESRSGSSFKAGIETGAGVIDSDYRGELNVKLYNFTDETYEVEKGQRIAQMVVIPYLICTPVESEIDNDTERGINGFGSTGK